MACSRPAWTAAAILPLAASAFLLLLGCDSLPDPRPAHWNWRGEPDRFGPKTQTAVFVLPLIGLLSLIAVMAASAAQSDDRDKPRPSPPLLIAAAWFGSLTISPVSLLPLIAGRAGVPWLLPAILGGAAFVCAIGIRDSRRAKGLRQAGGR